MRLDESWKYKNFPQDKRVGKVIEEIEKVFKSYAQDEKLREVLKESSSSLQLFPKHLGTRFYLSAEGEVYCHYDHQRGYFPSSIQTATCDYFNYLAMSKLAYPVTIEKAREKLTEDLGKRVEQSKKDYARHFDNECNRQAERYAQHPEV